MCIHDGHQHQQDLVPPRAFATRLEAANGRWRVAISGFIVETAAAHDLYIAGTPLNGLNLVR